VIGCLDPSRQATYYEDLHRHLPPQTPNPPPLPGLPAFIPVLGRGVPKNTLLPEANLYGVGWNSLFSETGTLKYRTPEHLRRALGLKKDARVCLIGTGHDESLESFWIKSEPHEALRQVAALDLTFSTTTTYSVWDDYPRFDQIYNQERNLATYEWLTGHGVPTIPFIFCALEPDYKAAAKWLDEHSEVEIIATSAQGYKGPLRFYEFMADLRRLQQISNRPLQFLIVGCCTGWKIDLLYEHFPIAAIVSGLPFGVGRSGHLCNADLSGRRPAPQNIPRSRLVEECIAACANYCAARALAASARKVSEVIQTDLPIREAEVRDAERIAALRPG
jgi:hypothetical protein